MFFISTKETRQRPRGSWCISLCLLHQSPPTFIDGKIVIDEYEPTIPTAASSPGPQTLLSPTPAKSSIVIPCKAFFQLLSTNHNRSTHNAVIMGLGDGPIGSSIQYKSVNYAYLALVFSANLTIILRGTTFIAPDETLRFKLHARLCKPTGRDPRLDNCVIC